MCACACVRLELSMCLCAVIVYYCLILHGLCVFSCCVVCPNVWLHVLLNCVFCVWLLCGYCVMLYGVCVFLCACFMVLVCVLHVIVCFVCNVLRDVAWVACL